MSIIDAFHAAFKRKEEKEWDTLYVLLDIHGTIMIPNYSGVSTEYYPNALEVLKQMGANPLFKLILWTCSVEEHRQHYKKLLEKEGIPIYYINENPEVEDFNWGDYTSKLYCSIGLDDKFGFVPSKDWIKIKKFLNKQL